MIPRSAALALLLAAASACSGDRTFDDPSQPIEVRAGSGFRLAIDSNQSTGFRWVLVDSAALGPLRHVATEYEIDDPNLNGGGGTEIWSFQAPAAGQGVVSVVNVRPWEKTVPKDTTRFRVTVR